MAVDNINVIDFVSTDPQGVVVLTISDHLEWDSENEHLLLLQNKINACLEALESGEIYDCYPDAAGKAVQIRVYFKYEPDGMGIYFLEKVKGVVEDLGYEFTSVIF